MEKIYFPVTVSPFYVVDESTCVLHLRVRAVVLNATFNNISVISWWLVLLIEVPGENHRPASSHWQILSHRYLVSSTPRRQQDSNSQH